MSKLPHGRFYLKTNSNLGSATSTPTADSMASLFGGIRCEGVCFTHDEIKNLKKVYGFVPPEKGESILKSSGDNRNLLRFVMNDGLRVMGILSKYLEHEEDPVVFVQQLMADCGFDVPDIIEEEENDENEKEE